MHQMKTILTELLMYGYWPGSVFMYVRGIEVCVCAHCVCVHVVCVHVVCACGVCVCACGVGVRVGVRVGCACGVCVWGVCAWKGLASRTH